MSVARPLIRDRREADAAACLDLLEQLRERDGYPIHLPPEDLPAFLTSDDEAGVWVAELDGRVVGHVALHCPAEDPTLAAAQRATGLPAERLAMVCRLFVAPEVRRSGLGRELLRHASSQALSLGRRAVLDVGQTLQPAAALYDSEGWSRVDALHLPLGPDKVLDLWVYVSPEPSDA